MVDLDMLTLQAEDGVLVEDHDVVVRLIGMIPILFAALGRVAHHDPEVVDVLTSLQSELETL